MSWNFVFQPLKAAWRTKAISLRIPMSSKEFVKKALRYPLGADVEKLQIPAPIALALLRLEHMFPATFLVIVSSTIVISRSLCGLIHMVFSFMRE